VDAVAGNVEAQPANAQGVVGPWGHGFAINGVEGWVCNPFDEPVVAWGRLAVDPSYPYGVPGGLMPVIIGRQAVGGQVYIDEDTAVIGPVRGLTLSWGGSSRDH